MDGPGWLWALGHCCLAVYGKDKVTSSNVNSNTVSQMYQLSLNGPVSFLPALKSNQYSSASLSKDSLEKSNRRQDERRRGCFTAADMFCLVKRESEFAKEANGETFSRRSEKGQSC